MTRPDFIIIGAMKCATSTLHDQLARQPGVFMTTPKEPNFFSNDEVYAHGLGWYEDLFRSAPPGSIRGESSTHYTKLPTYPETIDRLTEHAPDAKLVYVMRHPIDRLVSQYVHEWTKRLTAAPIDRAVDELPILVEYGRYAMQLRPFLERFGPDRVLPVFQERLRTHPQEQLERVAGLVGLAGPVRWQDDEGPKNVSAERMRDAPLRDLIVNAPGLKQIRRGLIPQSLRNKIKSMWQMQARPELSAAVRTRLEEQYDADLAELGRWLDLPLSCASFKRIAGETADPRFTGYPTRNGNRAAPAEVPA